MVEGRDQPEASPCIRMTYNKHFYQHLKLKQMSLNVLVHVFIERTFY